MAKKAVVTKGVSIRLACETYGIRKFTDQREIIGFRYLQEKEMIEGISVIAAEYKIFDWKNHIGYANWCGVNEVSEFLKSFQSMQSQDVLIAESIRNAPAMSIGCDVGDSCIGRKKKL